MNKWSKMSAKPTLTMGVAALTLGAAHAQATYTYNNIVDTTVNEFGAPFSSFSPVTINNGGNTVAFEAGYLKDADSGVFSTSANGGSFSANEHTYTTTVNKSPDNTLFNYLSGPTISGNTVAFRGNYDGTGDSDGESSLLSGTTASPNFSYNAFASTGNPAPTGTFIGFDGSPSVGGGTAAVKAEFNESNPQSGIFTFSANGNGLVYSTLATVGGAAPTGSFTSFDAPTIDNVSGSMVAFYGAFGGGSSGIFAESATGAGGYTALAVTGASTASGVGTFTSFGDPTISGSTVAFNAGYSGGASGTGSGIFTASTTGSSPLALVTTGTLAPTGTAFTSFGGLSITGGLVAFVGNYSGGDGIFTESASGGGYGLVVKRGDTLFGSTVASIGLSSLALDSSGDVAFNYTLANGVSGVAVARSSVSGAAAAPEPSALALIGALGGLVLPAKALFGRRLQQAGRGA